VNNLVRALIVLTNEAPKVAGLSSTAVVATKSSAPLTLTKKKTRVRKTIDNFIIFSAFCLLPFVFQYSTRGLIERIE
jgi:hypothetical protein